MTRKNYATCVFFESKNCPNVNSRTMQDVFSPGSVFKGQNKNIADVENIRHALEMCSACNAYKHKGTETAGQSDTQTDSNNFPQPAFQTPGACLF